MENKAICQMNKSEWEFIKSPDLTIITYFGLYCDREWLVHVTTSTLFIGWAVGSFVVSWLGDNYGRKVIIYPSCIMTIVFGFLSLFAPDIYTFIACRFIIGFFTPGNFHMLYVMMAEFVDNRNRPLAVTAITLSYSVWTFLLCLKAYFIRPWKYLMFACTLPYLLVIVFYKFVPESIHWAHLHGSKKDVMVILRKISKWNKANIPENIRIRNELEFEPHKSNPIELFKSLGLAILSSKLVYTWLVCGMLFFSMSLAADDLSGSFFRDFVIITIVEIPANVLSVYCCTRFGRKKTISNAMICASISVFCVALIPSTGRIKILRVVFGVIGKGLITMVFNGFLSWTLELYGTDLRANAMGVLNVATRVGGASSPWIAKALKHINPMAPFLVMGVLAFTAGCVMYTFPETKGVPLRTISQEKKEKEEDIDHIRNEI